MTRRAWRAGRALADAAAVQHHQMALCDSCHSTTVLRFDSGEGELAHSVVRVVRAITSGPLGLPSLRTEEILLVLGHDVCRRNSGE